jgi:hypothetical protein
MPAVRLEHRDALAAGLIAAITSGIPSTAWALTAGRDVRGPRAAGAIALPRERRTLPLLAAAVPVHLALSIGWAAVLERGLPKHHEPLTGAAAGLAIAALDLGVIGRRIPAIRALEQPPQWLDHLAFGLTVGLVLRARRGRSAHAPDELHSGGW